MGGYPRLAADYYLAVQVIQIPVDPVWIHNHLQLKSDGIMILDRTYCLDEDDLIDDLNILWVARQLSSRAD